MQLEVSSMVENVRRSAGAALTPGARGLSYDCMGRYGRPREVSAPYEERPALRFDWFLILELAPGTWRSFFDLRRVLGRVALPMRGRKGTAMTDPWDLMPAAEVRDVFGVCQSTEHRWRHDKKLGFPKPHRIGRKVFYDRAEMQRFIRDKLTDGRHDDA